MQRNPVQQCKINLQLLQDKTIPNILGDAPSTADNFSDLYIDTICSLDSTTEDITQFCNISDPIVKIKNENIRVHKLLDESVANAKRIRDMLKAKIG